MLIPENLNHLKRYETGGAWLEALPRRVSQLADQWSLQLGEPLQGASVSYVVPAVRARENLVLKIQWPHEECVHEADALAFWDGEGAVRLLDHDRENHALLLEHCKPGTTLSQTEGIDPITVLTELLPRLWKPAGAPFKYLAAEAGTWLSDLYVNWEAGGRKCEKRLIDAAATWLNDLKDSQGGQVLLHQDLHGDNILASQRQAWLAIDPKPLAGEREFSLAPAIRSFEFGHSKEQTLDRLDRLSGDLGLDRERVLGWTIGQTIAWSFDSLYAERHFETARWLLDTQ